MCEFLVWPLLRSERFTDRKNNKKPKNWSSSYLNKPPDISFDSKVFQSYTATDTGESSLQFDITLKTILIPIHKWAVCESKHFLSAPVTLAFLLFLHLLHLQEFQLVWFNPHWDRDLDLERDLLPKKNTLDQKWNLVVAKHFNHEASKNQKTIRAQDGVMPYYNKLWTIVTVEPRHNEPL